MDIDQLLSGENASSGLSEQLPDLTSSVSALLAPFMWLSVALTIVFIVLYINSVLRRRKLENAIFDIQKTLREMNERDKARTTSAASPARPQIRSEKETIIARSDEPRQKP